MIEPMRGINPSWAMSQTMYAENMAGPRQNMIGSVHPNQVPVPIFRAPGMLPSDTGLVNPEQQAAIAEPLQPQPQKPPTPSKCMYNSEFIVSLQNNTIDLVSNNYNHKDSIANLPYLKS